MKLKGKTAKDIQAWTAKKNGPFQKLVNRDEDDVWFTESWSAWFELALYGDEALVAAALDAGISPPAAIPVCGSSGGKVAVSVLDLAAASGLEGLVSSELKRGIRCANEDGAGPSPVFYAAAAGHVSILKQLVKAKIDLDHKTETGLTALSFAVAYGQKAAVKALLEAGADPAAVESKNKRNAARWAACGYVALRDYFDNVLVGLPAVDAESDEYWSAVAECIELVLAAAPMGNRIASLVDDAAEYGGPAVLALALKHAADAGVSVDRAELMEMVMDSSWGVDQKAAILEGDGETITIEADADIIFAETISRKQRVTQFEAAMARGASIPEQALAHAVEEDDAALAKSLVKHGARIDNSDPEERALLLLATLRKKKGIVESLLKAGASANARYRVSWEDAHVDFVEAGTYSALDVADQTTAKIRELLQKNADGGIELETLPGFDGQAYAHLIAGRVFVGLEYAEACAIVKAAAQSDQGLVAVPTTDLSEGDDDETCELVVGVAVANAVGDPEEAGSYDDDDAVVVESAAVKTALAQAKKITKKAWKSLLTGMPGRVADKLLSGRIGTHLVASGPLASAHLELPSGDVVSVSFDGETVEKIPSTRKKGDYRLAAQYD